VKPGTILWEDQAALPFKQETFGPGVLIRAHLLDALPPGDGVPTHLYDDRFRKIVSEGMRGKSTLITDLRRDWGLFARRGWVMAVLDWDQIRTDPLVLRSLDDGVVAATATPTEVRAAISTELGSPRPSPTITFLDRNMETVLNTILGHV
jgi:hypothetical protein